MTAIFVLDVPENDGVVRVAEQDPALVVDKVGPYFRVTTGDTDGEIVIDRRATGCRHAVWYSAVAGLQDARIVQHDKDALRAVARRAAR
ncbi:hypothetical protein [Pseudonocardia asaccharolytica]|uniref:Uncharacterized protein n=1 Tax=Pseudonocardia asaccharolytica DSM 44247 = NBRC 16224 TaxID=1123024 RepID=A0A511D258_9PSEU|nr:hypothetical protein [Pseudonocardia asaccharolytica]GEL17644.1 hypothetical protein PA7_14810 [Pseudonocardia asaccharolytica DSM 44247 = NBRC 16224]